MFDFSVLIDFYFTKWLFMASCVYGLFRLCKLLILNR